LSSGRWPCPPSAAVRPVALFLVWCGLTLFWGLQPGDGAWKAAQLTGVFAATLASLGVVRRLNSTDQEKLAWALASGVVIGLILLGVETVFDYPLQRALIGSANPRLHDLAESKRSVDALPVMVWSAALALGRIRKPWLGVLLAALFAAATFRLTTSSAVIGMMASLAMFALAAWSVPVARKLAAAGAAGAFILIIPASLFAYSPTMTPQSCGLKFSACHRIEIWHFAATKSLERPLFGHGLNSSRYVPNDGAVSAFQPPGATVMTLHPHDAFLQVWVELGAVGVVLAAALVIAALTAVRSWVPQDARFALAAYTGGAVVAGLAFGIWDTWWLATLAFAAVACTALAREVELG
jgi:O-antigen ligase